MRKVTLVLKGAEVKLWMLWLIPVARLSINAYTLTGFRPLAALGVRLLRLTVKNGEKL